MYNKTPLTLLITLSTNFTETQVEIQRIARI